MANENIFTNEAPAAVGPYCHAVKAGNMLFASGQLGLIPETGELAPGVQAQARQALANIRAVLRAAGMDLCDVVKTTVYLTDMADFAAINAVYAEAFGDAKPARACVSVAGLPKGGAFEIDAIAVKG